MLVDAQPELRQHRDQVVEQVGLDGLVVDPRRRIGEAVQFERNAFGRERQLPRHVRHVAADARMALQVVRDVCAERAEIGQLAAVRRAVAGRTQRAVPLRDRIDLVFEIILQQRQAFETFDLVVRQKAHARRIDEQRALDAAAARLGHPAPVLVALGDQLPRRHRDDRVIEVRDLDGVQRDVDHRAVRAGRRHRDPVADPQHVVRRQLHAGDEAEQRVLEDQHQHRRHRADAGQQQADLLAGRITDHDERGRDEHHELDELHRAFQRQARLVAPGRAVRVFERGQRRADGHRHEEHDQREQHLVDDLRGQARNAGHRAEPELDHDERHDAVQPFEGAEFEQRVVDARGGQPRESRDHAKQQEMHDGGDRAGGGEQDEDADERRQPGFVQGHRSRLGPSCALNRRRDAARAR